MYRMTFETLVELVSPATVVIDKVINRMYPELVGINTLVVTIEDLTWLSLSQLTDITTLPTLNDIKVTVGNTTYTTHFHIIRGYP